MIRCRVKVGIGIKFNRERLHNATNGPIFIFIIRIVARPI
ncbi:hypothetical protein EC07798_0236 [Escherichia coli 07798]|nr:hypothetical protein ECDEC1D_0510 [Escherichia coli DEC1D]EKI45961.1 hypothetical protein EC07798_0236 [Escherichia coli 07798]KDZ51698.1 hypothetical protein AB16_2226 [Escherichia coli 3-073-06_S1_C1]